MGSRIPSMRGAMAVLTTVSSRVRPGGGSSAGSAAPAIPAHSSPTTMAAKSDARTTLQLATSHLHAVQRDSADQDAVDILVTQPDVLERIVFDPETCARRDGDEMLEFDDLVDDLQLVRADLPQMALVL